MIALKRIVRDLRAYVQYPKWRLMGRPSPDSHIYKTARIIALGAKYGCSTFVETGTFYGETVNAVRGRFKKVFSIEIFPPLHAYNATQFRAYSDVEIVLGDSASKLPYVLAKIEGRTLFWLDGHYSGLGTGIGQEVSPLIKELGLIKSAQRCDHCILIDDRRLLGADAGYPCEDEVVAAIKDINISYKIYYDLDCLIAVPSK